MNKKLLAAAASILLVGAGCGSRLDNNVNVNTGVVTPPVNQPDDTTGGSMDMRIAGNAIIVGGQRPGSEINIELVENDAPAFVVIRDGSTTGAAVLGQSTLLPAGSTMPLKITLSRVSVDGETLYAYAYVDTDGSGSYGEGDQPLTAFNGEPLYATIDIDVNADTDPLLPRI